MRIKGFKPKEKTKTWFMADPDMRTSNILDHLTSVSNTKERSGLWPLGICVSATSPTISPVARVVATPEARSCGRPKNGTKDPSPHRRPGGPRRADPTSFLGCANRLKPGNDVTRVRTPSRKPVGCVDGAPAAVRTNMATTPKENKRNEKGKTNSTLPGAQSGRIAAEKAQSMGGLRKATCRPV